MVATMFAWTARRRDFHAYFLQLLNKRLDVPRTLVHMAISQRIGGSVVFGVLVLVGTVSRHIALLKHVCGCYDTKALKKQRTRNSTTTDPAVHVWEVPLRLKDKCDSKEVR